AIMASTAIIAAAAPPRESPHQASLLSISHSRSPEHPRTTSSRMRLDYRYVRFGATVLGPATPRGLALRGSRSHSRLGQVPLEDDDRFTDPVIDGDRDVLTSALVE